MEVKEEIETLKHKVQVGPHKGDNDDDDDGILPTAPSGLTEFTGRKSELEWLERNLVLLNPEKKPGTSTCIKTICGLGGCRKTSQEACFGSLVKMMKVYGNPWSKYLRLSISAPQ